MDGIDELIRQARAKRDTAILAAKREYNYAMHEIAALKRKLRLRRSSKPRPIDTSGTKATTVARAILLEGRPMTMVELVLEVQRRGCRAGDHPRAVAHAIRAGFRYYGREIRKDDKGRWSVM